MQAHYRPVTAQNPWYERLSARQADTKTGTTAIARGAGYAAAVLPCNRRDQGETQAGAAFCFPCASQSIEGLEDASALGLWHAGATVADAEFDFSIRLLHMDLDWRGCAGDAGGRSLVRRLAVALCVLQQIAHQPPQQARAATCDHYGDHHARSA